MAIPRLDNNNLSTNPSEVIANNNKCDYRQPPRMGISNRQDIKDIIIVNNNMYHYILIINRQFNNMPPINTARL